jgi:hypothetical protein
MIKVMRIGTIDTGRGRRASVHIKAEISIKVETDGGGELSITGVIGALPSGNALGGCGQIDMEFWHRDSKHNDARTTHLITPAEIDFAPGWDKDKWLDLLEVWRVWHLNHMTGGCEHMTGEEWDTSKVLTLYYFRTKKHVTDAVHNFKANAEQALKGGYAIQPTPEEQRLACLPDKITLASPEPSAELAQDYEPNTARYEGDHYNKASETKNAGWVYPKDHPGGLLTKPCPVCGYKYGSAWHKRELPQSVIDFLESLPMADRAPAWV